MISLSLLFFLLLIPSNAAFAAHRLHNTDPNFNFSTQDDQLLYSLPNNRFVQFRINNSQSDNVVIRGNSTILSENRTFELGFFSTNGGSSGYLGIWFASIPTPTRVWVANREKPIKDIASATLELTETGRLAIGDSNGSLTWQTTNTERAIDIYLYDNGNLVLLSSDGSPVWQSFDYPTDTWLPGMNITTERSVTSWRSLSDPSPGLYSLRLKPLGYNEFELVYNDTFVYWSTGNWTGNAFVNVPQMTIPYIYRFHFVDPYRSTASFWFTETPLEGALRPPLTRFYVDHNGQLKQFTWTSQTENWNMFWSQPENHCRVHSLCGDMGFCKGTLLKPCVCFPGFRPANEGNWENEDYSGGCMRDDDDSCKESDGFEAVGVVAFDRENSESFEGSRSICERSCLMNCSCIGLYHNGRTNLCKNLYGSMLNLRNLSSDGISEDVLYVRVPGGRTEKKSVSKSVVLVVSIVGSFALVAVAVALLVLLIIYQRRKKREGMEDGGAFPMLNLKVFSYKELQAATRVFSEKLGHGGFGTVFQGQLSDSSIVAVKRLERQGSGEKEFRAEVCTIGNIQHVNLVRLRGFCSENSHRLLVYDYMPNGPLSVYLRRDGPNLSWDVRFRIAVGTARGIAYLHEECRDCIIHCDIKPENILLDSDYTAKVSDFGLAKLIGRDFSRVLATMRGTLGYVAPEWISGLAITAKADVYSYGMTLLELLGGRRNVEAPPSAGTANCDGEGGNKEKWFFPPYAARQVIEGNVDTLVDPRLGDAYNHNEAERVAFVAIWCIQDNEEMRPTMGMVVKMLEGVVEVTVPPPPKLLQAFVSGESYRGIQVDSGNGESINIGSSPADNTRISNEHSQSSLGNGESIDVGSSPADNIRVSNEHSQSSVGNVSSPVYDNVKFD
ncbi:Receptor-like protein kinase 4 isoform 1 [Tripterygium wilfordii]|uniref:Receptor-like serine/threonine-protein kinase n=1 Tax=Tripterygium wilfordii TaxID=458696 RepID=A0A7J7CDD7_TRIWF|nr:G-type lectin S-receptor-like serine/threonine-protein kinase SD2-2 [Tripterygium wilfordii]KAF5731746.1 Receptor-like protein kinase 4 isoform 1 [Tripterygium wilfordii]